MKRERKRFVVDVTTLVHWSRPPVGIVRTLYEVVKWFHSTEMYEEVVFVKFSDDRSQLCILENDELSALLERLQQASFSLDKSGIPIGTKAGFLKRLGVLLKIKNDKINRAISYYQKNGLGSFIKKSLFHYYPNVYRKLMPNDVADESKKSDNNVSTLFDGSCYIGTYEKTFLRKEDVFISLGLDWDFSNYNLLYFLKKRVGFEFVGICYDLIPLSHPQYVQSELFSQHFFKHIYYLNYVSDRISCISNFSKGALLAFRKDHGISNSVDIETICIGDNLDECSHGVGLDVEFDFSEKYILYVSTIESRKNHVVLLKAYILAHQMKIDLPKLICVGMYGWGMHEFHELYNKSNFLRNKIEIFDRVDDKTLGQLYQNALFCAFPSHVEGWGLGAAEALVYGKVCLISNSEALREATQDLMPSIEAENEIEWMRNIHHYATHHEERKKLEEVIKQNFIPKSWGIFCEEFHDFARGSVQ